MRRCTKASAQPRQEVTKGRVGNAWGQRTSCVEGGAKAPEGSCGWTRLRENSSSESCNRNVPRDSDVWKSLRGGIQRWCGDG